MQTLQNAVVKLQLQALQADSDHRTMEALVRERDEELEERTAEYNEGEHSERASLDFSRLTGGPTSTMQPRRRSRL